MLGYAVLNALMSERKRTVDRRIIRVNSCFLSGIVLGERVQSLLVG